jgi:hypothetical protein
MTLLSMKPQDQRPRRTRGEKVSDEQKISSSKRAVVVGSKRMAEKERAECDGIWKGVCLGYMGYVVIAVGLSIAALSS